MNNNSPGNADCTDLHSFSLFRRRFTLNSWRTEETANTFSRNRVPTLMGRHCAPSTKKLLICFIYEVTPPSTVSRCLKQEAMSSVTSSVILWHLSRILLCIKCNRRLQRRRQHNLLIFLFHSLHRCSWTTADELMNCPRLDSVFVAVEIRPSEGILVTTAPFPMMPLKWVGPLGSFSLQ